jgi:acetyl esterase
MPVDPDIAPFLQRVNAKLPPPRPRPLADDRAAMHRLAEIVAPRPPILMHAVADSTVPGPDGDTPIRVYRPAPHTAAVVMYFHGGGWMTGDLDSHDFLVRKLAATTGFTFVAVDYRLAPEHRFPAGLHDCLAATIWVSDHPSDVGGAGCLAVAGDSAGGNLAAVVARTFRDRHRHLGAQLLLYPVIDSGGDYPSRVENGHGYLLTVDDIRVSAEVYLGDQKELLFSEDVAPIRAADLTGLAPAVIGAAHLDPLRDEALAYGQALTAAGVDVFAADYPGMIHTFAGLFAISAGADRALRQLLSEFTRRVLTTRPRRPAAGTM